MDAARIFSIEINIQGERDFKRIPLSGQDEQRRYQHDFRSGVNMILRKENMFIPVAALEDVEWV